MSHDHFTVSQVRERLSFQSLFDNYLAKHNCNTLIFTPTEQFLSYDATFYSGRTRCAVEHKKRNISLLKFSDCQLELTKYYELKEQFKRLSVPMFCVEYNECYALWDLSEMMAYEIQYDIHPKYLFTQTLCKSNGDRTSDSKRYKWVRYLNFDNATMIDKTTFQRFSYVEIWNRIRREQENANWYFHLLQTEQQPPLHIDYT